MENQRWKVKENCGLEKQIWSFMITMCELGWLRPVANQDAGRASESSLGEGASEGSLGECASEGSLVGKEKEEEKEARAARCSRGKGTFQSIHLL